MGFESAVKGATKSKLAAPKQKYIDSLLGATTSGQHAMTDVFHYLSLRLKDPTWTVVYKSLIVIHTLIRDGDRDVVLQFMCSAKTFRLTDLQTVGVSPMSEQGRNIHDYGGYLMQRVKTFASTSCDYSKARSDKSGSGRLRKLTIDKGLLRETEAVQKLIGLLIKCKLLDTGADNEVALAAFRLLVSDLLVLFQVANEGVINVLEHFFELSKPDAERALKIYKLFVQQTEEVIVYMSLARSLERTLGVSIPNLQHAPTSLGNSLEEYLRDADFEQNRLEYVAKKERKGASSNSSIGRSNTVTRPRSPAAMATADRIMLPESVRQQSNNTDLIDFFGSIDTTAQQPAQQPQVTGNPYMQQQQQAQMQVQANPYATAMQPQFTANPYAQMQQQQQQQQPMYAQNTGFQPQTTGYQQASFQPQTTGYQQQQQQQQQQPANEFQQLAGYQSQPQQQQQPAVFQPQTTGFQQANPYASPPIQAQSTGANPFRRSMLPPQQQQHQPQNNDFSTGYSNMMQQQRTGNPYSQPQQQSFASPSAMSQPQQQQQQFLQPQFTTQPLPRQTTGNPFTQQRIVSEQMHLHQQQSGYHNQLQQNATGSMMPAQLTGSTGNPFRRSMMPQSTGMAFR